MPNKQIIDEASMWFVTLRVDRADDALHDRFMGWLRKSPEHVRAYLGILEFWAELPNLDPGRLPDAAALLARGIAEDRVVTLATQDVSRDLLVPGRQSKAGASKNPPSRGSLLAAASVAILCLLAGTGIWIRDYVKSTFITGVGEHRSLKLPDGSSVELNARSRIRLRFSARQRRVELIEGQALFEVAHDPRRPFFVDSAGARVRAVGTRFDVYRKGSDTIVTVLEGRVAIFPEDRTGLTGRGPAQGSTAPPATLLAAGEQLTVSQHGVSRPIRPHLGAATAWTEGRLIFDSTRLSSVIGEFNRYNARQFVLSGAVEDFPITAVFASTDVDALVDFLHLQPDLRVEAIGEEILISSRSTPSRAAEK